jgi:hypothetical protein
MSTTSGTPWRWWVAPGGHCQKAISQKRVAPTTGRTSRQRHAGRWRRRRGRPTPPCRGVGHVVGHLLDPVGRVGPLVVLRSSAGGLDQAGNVGLGERLQADEASLQVNGSSMSAAGRPPPVRRRRSRAGAPARTRPRADEGHDGGDHHQVVQGGRRSRCGRRVQQERVAGGDYRDLAAAWRTSPADMAAWSWHRPGGGPAFPRALWLRTAECVDDLALEDGAEHGDAGGDADLAEGVVGARGHAAALGWTTEMAPEARTGLTIPMPARHDEAGQQHGPGRVRDGCAP